MEPSDQEQRSWLWGVTDELSDCELSGGSLTYSVRRTSFSPRQVALQSALFHGSLALLREPTGSMTVDTILDDA